MISKDRITEKAAQYGISLEKIQLEQLDKYAELLLEWNKKINLTAITKQEDIENKHFIDSLLLAMQPELKGSIVDVGSGAGFPGLVCKIFKNTLDITLMEPTGKRILFLETVAEAIALDVRCVKERAEEAARKKWRESFSVATARAVASLPALCEYCLPLVKVGGYFLAMKGEAEEEIAGAKNAIEKLGGCYLETRKYILPDESSRSIVVIKKIETTGSIYPRNGARIAKKPL